MSLNPSDGASAWPPAPSPLPVAARGEQGQGRLGELLRWYESCRAGGHAAPTRVRLLLGEHGPEWSLSALPDDAHEARWATVATGADAFEFGRKTVDQQVDSGTDLLLLADSPQARTAGTAAIAAIVDIEPVAAVGWGEPGEERRWVEEVAAVRDERHRLYGAARDPERLVGLVAKEIAVTAGFCLQAALRRTPVLLDGEVSAAGALIAARLSTGASAWWHAAHRTSLPAHEKGLARLGLAPTLALDLAGGGLGPVLALQALRTALRALS
ncbi:MAG: nicotinate-nucleotide--dimethylbenzimidazole phosphoribosyltransferase [Segniliparus sp.]|uniref:nicotinate-nucleotide--dimethylbenzimidazole phosphoribosyltransferase n=1 Tax=Segniliparus sp. TaxID=2804064 RepID=UPI003F33E1E4